jgi:hypothetical protein
LQRSAGNHAVAGLLAREPASPSPAGEATADAQRLSQLETRINDRADPMLTLWVSANMDALNSLPAPTVDDPSGQMNFWVALGGNLLWAATSLMPEWSVVMIPMSVGGAAVGSGSLAQDPAAQPPSPRDALGKAIFRARDQLLADVAERAPAMAATMAARGITDPEHQDSELWRELFGTAPVQDSSALRETAASALRGALETYTAAYRQWENATMAEAQARLDAAGGLTPPPSRDHPPTGTPIGVAFDQTLIDVRRERPFDVNSVRFEFTSSNQLAATPPPAP